MSKLLFKSGDDWTPEILDAAWEEIDKIGREELRQTYYKPQIEIVSAKQMLDAYTSVGMPLFYKHWSFGKEYVANEKAYKNGDMGLAYEMVINSNPCIAYLMEENDATVQTMVMAHASVGHAAVFTNNYLFKEQTDASSIIDYLNFAKNYIKSCEEKYGYDEVEATIDACHALQNYGIDKYKRPKKLSPAQEEKKAFEKFERELSEYDPVWEKTKITNLLAQDEPAKATLDSYYELPEPQENLLYFIEKNAPHLPTWKREIIRIVRKLAQYFHPQGQTKVLNEGFATFCHYYIMERLWEKGLLDSGSMMKFYGMHANVVYQGDFHSFNPYKLGFEIFRDIKRICENPTDEDKFWFPQLIGKDWVEEIDYAMRNFKDETFILQYLSPKVARDMKMFSFHDKGIGYYNYVVTDISDEAGFRNLRSKLASSYAIENRIPSVQVVGVDKKGSRKMVLKHFIQNGRPIDIPDAKAVVAHLAELWEYTVQLETFEYSSTGVSSDTTLTCLGRYSYGKSKPD
jgi:stage V sporulation protein R